MAQWGPGLQTRPSTPRDINIRIFEFYSDASFDLIYWFYLEIIIKTTGLHLFRSTSTSTLVTHNCLPNYLKLMQFAGCLYEFLNNSFCMHFYL